jgi:hypothetical protein
MPWQKWFLIHALELHPDEVDDYGDPVFRFRKILLLVGRQNGKSTVMQALTLWRMYVDRCSLVIGTAQDLEVAESLWAESLDMAEETEELKVEIGKIERQPGRKKFRLRSGEEYKVKAASRRGGRGLSGELVLLDELREHQSWDAWSAVTKTTNAKARAQIYGISNAGDASSLVLRYLRKMAHAELGDPDGINDGSAQPAEELLGDEFDEDDDIDSALAIFEWSAKPGADILDRDAWAQANPSLGYRVRESTLASDASTDPEWVFRTECLCQWSDGTLEGPFPPGTWDAGRWVPASDGDVPPQIVGKVKACVDISHDRTMTYVAFAGFRADGLPQVEIVAQRAGDSWVEGWLTDDKRRDLIEQVTGQSKGAPVSALMKDLELAGLPVEPWQGDDLPGWTGSFYDLVRAGAVTDAGERVGVRHLPQPALDIAAATAVTKPLGDRFAWDRKHSPTDIAPLVAATGAVGLLTRKQAAPRRSKYEDEDLVVV